MIEQSSLNNEKVKAYSFLKEMYGDSYFPDFLVDKCKQLLLLLCHQIETTKPSDFAALYTLTHTITEQLNDLQDEFYENDSEIETAARDCLGMDIEFIAVAYGFETADVEELIAPRDW